jgi:plastocyanin
MRTKIISELKKELYFSSSSREEVTSQKQSGIFRQAIVISAAASVVIFLTSGMLLSTISVNIIPNSYANNLFFVKAFGALESIDNKTDVTNKTKKISLDGVVLSVYPKVEPELTTITMKISDEKTGFPLTHVDWVIKVSTPEGKEVFKSSTMHSHLGTNELSYKFLQPGKNTVSVLVASLGPKMLGMDVPPSGHTRIFKSGDPMTGWMIDQTYFFGARTAEFTIDIPFSQEVDAHLITDTINDSNREQERGSSKDTSNATSMILNGSENGTKVKLELSTIPEKIVAGKPVTLVLKVKSTDNDSLITHPDALLTISNKESGKLLQSAPPVNLLMPINGAFHGHTGEKGITTIFPSPGMYKIDLNVNSILGSNYNFGHVKTTFDLIVADYNNETTTTFTNTLSSQIANPTSITTAIPISADLNRVAIIGQDSPFYTPDHITVKPETTLTFKNHDAVVHTATGTNDGINVVSPISNSDFDTGLLSTGQEKQIPFNKEGIYNYFCEVHPFMRGVITVSR